MLNCCGNLLESEFAGQALNEKFPKQYQMNNSLTVCARGLSAVLPPAAWQTGKIQIMNRRLFALWTCAFLGFCELMASGETSPQIAGHWLGSVPMPDGSRLRVGINISEEAGALKATLDIPEQFAMNIPGDKVVLTTNNLRIEFSAIGTAFEGEMIDAETMRGGLKKGGVGEEFDWKRAASALAGPPRPQEPKRPFPYLEKEVQIENPEAGIHLAGTLTLPRSAENFPAVVLLSGSGPNDRDELIWGHKVFLVLSDWLTRQGIAVLRMDDRGTGKSSGDYSKAGLDDFASDALAGVRFLKRQKEIDPRRIGLVGHSEGGMIAPVAATRSADVAFIVLLAGPVEPPAATVDYQYRQAFQSLGASEAAIAKYLAHQQRLYKILKEEKEYTMAEKKYQQSVDQLAAELTPEEKQQLRFDEQQERAGVAATASPEFRTFIIHQPQQTLASVKCPVLALYGSKDLQVEAGRNMVLAREAFAKGHNRRATVKCLEGLNHLFQTAATPSDTHYEKIAETMSPVALTTISDWIAGIAKSNRITSARDRSE